MIVHGTGTLRAPVFSIADDFTVHTRLLGCFSVATPLPKHVLTSEPFSQPILGGFALETCSDYRSEVIKQLN